jgi:tetratricopeptide (TPR) repeat protein
MDEGLAEFYQNTDIRDKEVVVGEPSPENILLLRQEHLLPLPVLFTVDHNSPYYHQENKGSIFYAESWALIHYLQVRDRQQNTNCLADYARLVSQNVDAVTAAERAFGDLKQLQAALDKYVGQRTFYQFKASISAEIDDTTFKVQAITLPQADAVRADFLVYNQRVKDARPLLDRVLRDDPGNASAHETMGYLEFRQGNLSEARKWYEQAVKLNSQSFLAYYYFAAITVNGGQLDPENKSQVEISLRTAIKLNPSFAPAYDELAVLYGMRRENLDEAHTLALNAVQLDPGNLHYRLSTANILLQMQRPRDAIAVLQNARSLARTTDEVSSVQNLLEAAQQYQASREPVEPSGDQGVQSAVPQGQSSAQALPVAAKQPAPEEPHGPRRGVKGTIKDVKCSLPAVMELTVEGGGKTLSLQSNNYFKIQFSASNFTPNGALNPCTDLAGMKANIQFFEASGKSAEGQLFPIELSK